MDIATILIGVMVLLICVVPFIIMRKNKKKKAIESKEVISQLAAKSNSNVDEYDRWNKTIIGIDHLNRKLFFIRKIKDKEIQHEIDLSGVQMARVINSHRGAIDGNYIVIQKLQLGLISKDKDKPETLLEFYNADYDSLTIMEELQLAEKWAKIVKSNIEKKTTV
jgi:hypothetical protein